MRSDRQCMLARFLCVALARFSLGRLEEAEHGIAGVLAGGLVLHVQEVAGALDHAELAASDMAAELAGILDGGVFVAVAIDEQHRDIDVARGLQCPLQVVIEHFRADHVLSFSWGGACTLLALAHQPRLVKKAIVSSFSPVINEPMRDYLERGCQYLAACDRYQVGNLVNDTIGKHLPSLFKRFNYRHVSSLDSHEYAQMLFHINQVLQHDLERALKGAANINIPVMFINGDRDEYTTAEDARQFGKHVDQSHFSVIKGAGHFLDMEHKTASEALRNVMLGFLKPTTREPRQRNHYVQGHHALAI